MRHCLSLFLIMILTSLAAAETTTTGTVKLDIPYIMDAGHDQQLDLYTPGSGDFPTLLIVHGGGLTSGDRKDEPISRICRTFQSLGIACAAMSYRLAPNSKWPDQPEDVVAAFKWIKENIRGYGGDPHRIFLLGHSSGCLLVAMVASDKRYLEKQDLTQKDIAGAITMGCRLNDIVTFSDTAPESYESSWAPEERIDDFMATESAYVSVQQRNEVVPASYVDNHLPPMLVMIAEKERFFPPVLRDGAEFVGRALVAGAEADILILDECSHMSAFENMVTSDDPGVSAVLRFIQSHKGSPPTSAPIPH